MLLSFDFRPHFCWYDPVQHVCRFKFNQVQSRFLHGTNCWFIPHLCRVNPNFVGEMLMFCGFMFSFAAKILAFLYISPHFGCFFSLVPAACITINPL